MIEVKIDGITKWQVNEYTFTDPQMGIRSISMTVKHPSMWTGGDAVPEVANFSDAYVEYNGETYNISSSKPTAEKNNTSLDYIHTLIFKGAEDELTRRKVRDLALVSVDNYVSQGTIFSIYADINQFAQLIENNLAYYFGTKWTVTLSSAANGSAMVEVNNMSIWDLLLKTYEYYGVRWRIYGHTIDVGYTPDVIQHSFDYGHDGGLVKITRTAQSDPTINRLIGVGGSRNVPINYFTDRYHNFPVDPNPIGDYVNLKNVMPKVFRDSVIAGVSPYIDYVEDSSLVASDGVKEDSLEPNEEIYPSIAGVEVAGIGRIDQIIAASVPIANTPDDAGYSPTFDIWVKDIGFDLSQDVYTSTQDAKISFTSGMLSGYEFVILAEKKLVGGEWKMVRKVEVDTSKSYGGVQSKYKITLINSSEEYQATGQVLPNTVVNALPGDSFVILDIIMPQTYVELAELRLQNWLEEQLAERKTEKPTYAIDPISSFFEEYSTPESDGKTIKEKLKSGNKLTVNNTRVTNGAQELHINNITIQYGDLLPRYSFVVTDKVTVQGSVTQRIQSSVKTVEFRQNEISNKVGEVYSTSHTHNNKSLLDLINQGNIDVLSKLFVDESDNLYTTQNFYSQQNVSAYGIGSGGGGGGGSLVTWGTTTNNFVDLTVEGISKTVALKGHTHSKSEVGLSNVDNVKQLPLSQKGAVGGVAELDENGKVLASQLPSYVDDVLEYANIAGFPTTGETGKIYTALNTNKIYRWSGTTYIEISSSLALGETSSTAYRGDRGKTAYDHSQSEHQTIINGTGFVKAAGKTLSYDNTTYEVSFAKNTAFNKNFGTTSGTVAQGNDSRISNGQTAYSWGNHASAGYALNTALTAHTGNTTVHITSTERTNWNDANSKKHTHANKLIIDKLTQGNIDVLSKLSIDASGNLKIDTNAYSTGELSAYGLGSEGGGSGGGVDMLDSWANYTTAKANYYVPANLLVPFRNDTLSRLTSLESGSATSIVTTGTGNAITSLTKSGTVITANKGLTFLETSIFNTHNTDNIRHITGAERTKWNGVVTDFGNLEIGGRNLRTGTYNDWRVMTMSGSYGVSTPLFAILDDWRGKNVTHAFEVKDIPTGEAVRIRIDFHTNASDYVIHTSGNVVYIEGKSYVTYIVPADTQYTMIRMRVIPVSFSSPYSFLFRCEKLEFGNKPTDWTPAPEDQVSDWNTTDVNSFSFIKNKPTSLSQFTDNIGVATHIANTSNPHSVTKAQVGLGNVDNTADSEKNVLSATKLQTPRTIWGRSFDGTGNVAGALSGATTGSFTGDVTVNTLNISSTALEAHIAFSRPSPNYISTPLNGGISFVTNGGSMSSSDSVLILSPTGNIGVGKGFTNNTTSITAQLHVRGDILATGTTTTTKVIFNAAGWSMEQVGSELQMKHNNVLKMRFTSTGSIVATNEITAFA